MDFEETARKLYRDGKLVIDATRDLAVSDDLIRWARGDLDETLLDLKPALMEDDGDEVEERYYRAVNLIRDIRERFNILRSDP